MMCKWAKIDVENALLCCICTIGHEFARDEIEDGYRSNCAECGEPYYLSNGEWLKVRDSSLALWWNQIECSTLTLTHL